MADEILVEQSGGLTAITLNRPGRHSAFDDVMSDMFQPILFAALDDPDCTCILIRANGPSFCSDRDTAVLGHRARDESDFHFVRRHRAGESADHTISGQRVGEVREQFGREAHTAGTAQAAITRARGDG